MRSRQLLVAVLIPILVALLTSQPVSAAGNDGNATVTSNADGEVVLTVFEAGSRIVGPAAPAWLSKCRWFTTTRAGVDLAYASYQGHAAPTPQHFIDLGVDPDEEFAMVECRRTPDVLAAAPVVGLTGYLGAWAVSERPPQMILDWLVASTRARVEVPVQIGSSAPSGLNANSSWITQLETWLWVDPTVWQPQSVRSDSLFGTFVTVTATPYEVVFEDDDGHYINCGDNVGRPWFSGISRQVETRCSITPEHTSHTGDRWLRSTIRWQVTYTCNQYCGSGQLNDYVIINTRPIITHEILVVET